MSQEDDVQRLIDEFKKAAEIGNYAGALDVYGRLDEGNQFALFCKYLGKTEVPENLSEVPSEIFEKMKEMRQEFNGKSLEVLVFEMLDAGDQKS